MKLPPKWPVTVSMPVRVRSMTVSMTDHSPEIEVIASVQRRRRWSAAEKIRMVEDTYQPGATVSLVARQHGVGPNQLFTWRRLAAQGALTAAAAGEEVIPASEHRALQQQVRELQRLLGKKTLEAEILKEVLEQAAPKKRLLLRSSWPAPDGSR
jgi:transposase